MRSPPVPARCLAIAMGASAKQMTEGRSSLDSGHRVGRVLTGRSWELFLRRGRFKMSGPGRFQSAGELSQKPPCSWSPFHPISTPSPGAGPQANPACRYRGHSQGGCSQSKAGQALQGEAQGTSSRTKQGQAGETGGSAFLSYPASVICPSVRPGPSVSVILLKPESQRAPLLDV